MIFASGTMKVKADAVDAAKEAMQTLMAAAASQPGYQAYVFSQSLQDPSLFHYFEKWDSMEEMMANMSTEHGATFMKSMGPIMEKAEALKYEGASQSNLM